MDTNANGFTSAAISDRGLNETRPQNEDSFLELPQIGLFAVADGVGGAQAGEVASQMAVEILGEAFANMDATADPEEMMRIALDRANEAIFQMSSDLPQLSSMATTIVALHVSSDIATIAHVGDSRVYRVDPNGKLFRETDDHSVVEEEVRAGRMTPEQALNHPSRNVISRALGAEDTVEPDVKCVLIHPATTFLLCSDGITRHIDDAEIETLLASEFGPDDICARMKEICFTRGAEDNLTAVIVSFPGDRKLMPVAVEDDDIEEVTVATARQDTLAPDAVEQIETLAEVPESEPVSVAKMGADELNEADTEEFETSADDGPYMIEEPAADQGVFTESAAASPISDRAEPVTVERPADIDRAPAAGYRGSVPYAEEKRSGGILSSIGLLILGLLIGGAIGAAAGYQFLKPSPQTSDVPQISEQKSNNVPLTSFEETRRLVDANPAAYLNANAVTPQEADDYFWLGRALLLTGKPVEAKRAYEEAKRLLPTTAETSNIRTMSNEIEMALAIVNSPQATEIFTKEVAAASNAAGSNGNFNPIR